MKKYTNRLSYKRYKKMRSHVLELRDFVSESIGAMLNMFEAGMEEEARRNRKDDTR